MVNAKRFKCDMSILFLVKFLSVEISVLLVVANYRFFVEMCLHLDGVCYSSRRPVKCEFCSQRNIN